jgi:hypothetical protein
VTLAVAWVVRKLAGDAVEENQKAELREGKHRTSNIER